MSEAALFGLEPVWRGNVKVQVSDPSRTIVDLLSDPMLGGGLRSTVDMLQDYLAADQKDLDLLLEYADRFGNGAVLKRLGYLLERIAPKETAAIARCRVKLTAGNTKLDPQLPAKRLITRWRLWVPLHWT